MNERITLKILHILETAQGGLATYLHLLHTNLPKNWEQDFILPRSDIKNYDKTMSITPFDSENRSLKGLWRMIQTMRRNISNQKPDIIFFHSTFSLVALAALKVISPNIPTIYCAHSWAINRFENKNSVKARLVRLIEGGASSLATRTLNISNADHALAKKYGYGGNHITIENAARYPALDARDDLFSTDPASIHLLFVGRFDRQKGLDVLLDAFEKSRIARSDLRLHIIGAKVRNDSGHLSLPQGVELVGWVDSKRIDDWYASADILILPSRWEGLPLVLTESMRNGTPVACSRRSGMENLISEGKTGFSFELDANALCNRLLLLEKQTLRNMRQPVLSAFRGRYSEEIWTGKMKNLVNEVVLT